MSMRLSSLLILTALLGCAERAEPEKEALRIDDFGLAVRSNMEAQIIAKEGEVQTLAPAPGPRRSLAIGRYQTDRVETPIQVFTIDE